MQLIFVCRFLYLATLVNLFINSAFLLEALGFSIYKKMSTANKDNFTSSFPIWMPFISYSCLITLAKTSSTILNRSGKSGNPCLVSDLGGKAFSFSPVNMKLVVGLSYMAFTMLRYISYNLSKVLSEKCVEFCQIHVSASIEIISRG